LIKVKIIFAKRDKKTIAGGYKAQEKKDGYKCAGSPP
jgi:hypothetical protein